MSQGEYFSVMSHSNRVYAAQHAKGDIEIYGHSDETWWGLRRIQTPMKYHNIRLWVNDSSIFASSLHYDTIFIYNHDGSIKCQHGVYGEGGEAGQLRYPLLCHGDDDGDVLIADYLNRRLQVLHDDGHFSVVEINAAPECRLSSAVYIPGRFYILENEGTGGLYKHRISVYLPEQLNDDIPVQIQDLFR